MAKIENPRRVLFQVFLLFSSAALPVDDIFRLKVIIFITTYKVNLSIIMYL